MSEDTTDNYLEKEINVIMMGSYLDQRFRAALLGWAKMLMHRARRNAVKECSEIIQEFIDNRYTIDTMVELTNIKKKFLSLLEQKP